MKGYVGRMNFDVIMSQEVSFRVSLINVRSFFDNPLKESKYNYNIEFIDKDGRKESEHSNDIQVIETAVPEVSNKFSLNLSHSFTIPKDDEEDDNISSFDKNDNVLVEFAKDELFKIPLQSKQIILDDKGEDSSEFGVRNYSHQLFYREVTQILIKKRNNGKKLAPDAPTQSWEAPDPGSIQSSLKDLDTGSPVSKAMRMPGGTKVLDWGTVERCVEFKSYVHNFQDRNLMIFIWVHHTKPVVKSNTRSTARGEEYYESPIPQNEELEILDHKMKAVSYINLIKLMHYCMGVQHLSKEFAEKDFKGRLWYKGVEIGRITAFVIFF